jgi:hypothetical protein
MKGRPTRVTAQPVRYSSFDPDRWWETRSGIRTEIVEFQTPKIQIAVQILLATVLVVSVMPLVFVSAADTPLLTLINRDSGESRSLRRGDPATAAKLVSSDVPR